MRRILPAILLALVLAAPALRADEGPPQPAPSLLGAGGEVYHVQRGLYRDLFANPPAALAGNPVLALDVVRDGKTRRTLVPDSEGPAAEQAAALVAGAGGVYLLWGDGRQMTVVGFADDAWGEPYTLELDAMSTKLNPQLITTTDRFSALGDDQPVAVERTILHLVWLDRGAAGDRVLYTALVIENGVLRRVNRVFDLQQIAGGGDAGLGTAGTAPASLQQGPQLRRGRDGKSAVAGFVDRDGGELVTLELRGVGGDLVGMADKARVVIIDIGRKYPGASRSEIADKARMVVIEIGRAVLKPAVGDFVAAAFLASVAGSDPGVPLEAAAGQAAQVTVEQGASLLTLPAKDDTRTEILEAAGVEDGAGPRELLDLRHASRRPLPALPPADVRLFLSADGGQASLAWGGAGFVRYRETTPEGWSSLRTLALGPAFSRDDAFALVAKRLTDR
ncbi:MAG TPA: hypothetical protein VGV61_01700 [Thermoanaerobaculia bacterium]|jgi:hypothetical protein|nr:hypothetical protein [Thermoanaerobaculia bacterium]